MRMNSSEWTSLSGKSPAVPPGSRYARSWEVPPAHASSRGRSFWNSCCCVMRRKELMFCEAILETYQAGTDRHLNEDN